MAGTEPPQIPSNRYCGRTLGFCHLTSSMAAPCGLAIWPESHLSRWPGARVCVRAFERRGATLTDRPSFVALLRRLGRALLREVLGRCLRCFRANRPRSVLRLGGACEVRAQERAQTLRVDLKRVRQLLRRNVLRFGLVLFVRHLITSFRLTSGVLHMGERTSSTIRDRSIAFVDRLVRSLYVRIVARTNDCTLQRFHPPLGGRDGGIRFVTDKGPQSWTVRLFSETRPYPSEVTT